MPICILEQSALEKLKNSSLLVQSSENVISHYALQIRSYLVHLEVELEQSAESVEEHQDEIEQNLFLIIRCSPGVSMKKNVARCLRLFLSSGRMTKAYSIIGKLHDILKQPSHTINLGARTASVVCLGELYQQFGHQIVLTANESLSILLKFLKSAEVPLKVESLSAVGNLVDALGTYLSPIFRDIYKSIRSGLTDKFIRVRQSTAECLRKMIDISSNFAVSDADNIASLCIRSFEGADYEARLATSDLLAAIIDSTLASVTSKQKSDILTPTQTNDGISKTSSISPRPVNIDDTTERLSKGDDIAPLAVRLGLSSKRLKSAQGLDGIFEQFALWIQRAASMDLVEMKETRSGICLCYVFLVGKWRNTLLPKYSDRFLQHLMSILTKPKVIAIDFVGWKYCLENILAHWIGRYCNDHQRTVLVNNGIALLLQELKSYSPEKQYGIVFLLESVRQLILYPGVALTVEFDIVRKPVLSALLTSSPVIRNAAAVVLKAICVSFPSKIYELVRLCISARMDTDLSTHGFDGVLRGLACCVAQASHSSLGVSSALIIRAVEVAEQVILSSEAMADSEEKRIKCNAAWLLLAACSASGALVLSSIMQVYLLLWKKQFKKLPTSKGDSSWDKIFSMNLVHLGELLSSISNSLLSLQQFVLYSKLEIPRQLLKRFATRLIYPCLILSNGIRNNLKVQLSTTPSQEIIAALTLLRLRCYTTLRHMSLKFAEPYLVAIARSIVADIAGTEVFASPILLPNSLYLSLIKSITIDILGQKNSVKGSEFEEPLYLHIEYSIPVADSDPVTLVDPFINTIGSKPLETLCVDNALLLWTKLFPGLPLYLQAQCLDAMINGYKESVNIPQKGYSAASLNILTCLSMILSESIKVKQLFASELLAKIKDLLMMAYCHEDPMIRVLASESTCQLAYILRSAGKEDYAHFFQSLLEKIQNEKDMLCKAALLHAMGCVWKSTNASMGQSVGKLLSMAIRLAAESVSDLNSSVSIASMISLALLADSTGVAIQMQRDLLNIVITAVEHERYSAIYPLLQSASKVFRGIVNVLGPELVMDVSMRPLLLDLCNTFKTFSAEIVGETLSVITSLVLFSSATWSELGSWITLHIHSYVLSDHHCVRTNALILCKTWLHMLPTVNIARGIHKSLISMLEREAENSPDWKLAKENLMLWTALSSESEVREVVSVMKSIVNETMNNVQNVPKAVKMEDFVSETENERLNEVERNYPETLQSLKVSTKILAIECLSQLMTSKTLKKTDLVREMNDLIQIASASSTHPDDELSICGLLFLKKIIRTFCEDEDVMLACDGEAAEKLLKQYQANVVALLRPVFENYSSPFVIAVASAVCAEWICCAISTEITDIQRMVHLLEVALTNYAEKLSSTRFNDGISTMLQLALLSAWARVFVFTCPFPEVMVATIKTRRFARKELANLMQPHLLRLTQLWIFALRDMALLSISESDLIEFNDAGHNANAKKRRDSINYSASVVDEFLAVEGVLFSTSDRSSVRPFYDQNWSAMMLALCYTLNTENYDLVFPMRDSNETNSKSLDSASKCKLNFCLIVSLCHLHLSQPKCPTHLVLDCLEGLLQLFTNFMPQNCSDLLFDSANFLDLMAVLQRLPVWHDDIVVSVFCLNVALKSLLFLFKCRKWQKDESSLLLKNDKENNNLYDPEALLATSLKCQLEVALHDTDRVLSISCLKSIVLVLLSKIDEESKLSVLNILKIALSRLEFLDDELQLVLVPFFNCLGSRSCSALSTYRIISTVIRFLPVDRFCIPIISSILQATYAVTRNLTIDTISFSLIAVSEVIEYIEERPIVIAFSSIIISKIVTIFVGQIQFDGASTASFQITVKVFEKLYDRIRNDSLLLLLIYLCASVVGQDKNVQDIALFTIQKVNSDYSDQFKIAFASLPISIKNQLQEALQSLALQNRTSKLLSDSHQRTKIAPTILLSDDFSKFV